MSEVQMPSADAIMQKADRAAAHKRPELAYALWESAYKEFAQNHTTQEDQAFVQQWADHFKTEHVLPDIAAAFGAEQLWEQPLDARLSSKDLEKLRTDKRNPLNQTLATELIADAPSLRAKNEPWYWPSVLDGFTTSGVSARDVNHYLDTLAPKDRAIEMERLLLDGKTSSVFDAVARETQFGKNPNTVELTKDDFAKFYELTQQMLRTEPDPNIQALLQRDESIVRQVLLNWDEASGKMLTKDGPLSRRSIIEVAYPAASVLSDPQIFNRITEIAMKTRHSQEIDSDDIHEFVRQFVDKHAGGPITGKQRYQLDVLEKLVRRLHFHDYDLELGLLGAWKPDNLGGHIYFTQKSIGDGISHYLFAQQPSVPELHKI
jgi:hypothetical protein